jgi:hypothetical protein
MLPFQITPKRTNLSRTSRPVLDGLLQGDTYSMKIGYASVAKTILAIAQTVTSIAFLLMVFVMCVSAQSHRPVRHGGTICGNPKVTCKTSVTFQSNDLPFQVDKNMVIIDTVPFYAVILKSAAVKDDNCDVFIPESDRLAAQELFPANKVFSSRCIEPDNLFYEEVGTRKPRILSETYRIMAVYAGKTLAEAKKMLEAVKANGNYPGANIRRLRTGFNGT